MSLVHESHPLAQASRQLQVLRPGAGEKRFDAALRESDLHPLRATGIDVLQLNLGRRCNMACRHCHVDAAPDRREVMSRQTAEACLDVLARTDVPTLDVTGGAPEINPSFGCFVEEGRRLGRHVIDRSNLTLFTAPRYRDVPAFLAGHRVEIVASLPCYLEENVDCQRGGGVFAKSVEVLRQLNALGYGRADG